MDFCQAIEKNLSLFFVKGGFICVANAENLSVRPRAPTIFRRASKAGAGVRGVMIFTTQKILFLYAENRIALTVFRK